MSIDLIDFCSFKAIIINQNANWLHANQILFSLANMKEYLCRIKWYQICQDSLRYFRKKSSWKIIIGVKQRAPPTPLQVAVAGCRGRCCIVMYVTRCTYLFGLLLLIKIFVKVTYSVLSVWICCCPLDWLCVCDAVCIHIGLLLLHNDFR